VSTDGLGCVSASTVDLGSAPGTQRTARCLSPAISLESGTPQPLPLVTLRAASNKSLISVCRHCLQSSRMSGALLDLAAESFVIAHLDVVVHLGGDIVQQVREGFP
jgi:hypothetical protein